MKNLITKTLPFLLLFSVAQAEDKNVVYNPLKEGCPSLHVIEDSNESSIEVLTDDNSKLNKIQIGSDSRANDYWAQTSVFPFYMESSDLYENRSKTLSLQGPNNFWALTLEVDVTTHGTPKHFRIYKTSKTGKTMGEPLYDCQVRKAKN